MFDLTPEQRAAVEHDRGNLLIVAGAGTGKTTTLAARLAHLTTAGVSPERVMLLTFSRRSATELSARAATWSGADRIRGVWGGTFHSVANRLLRRFGNAVGISPAATLLDPADAAELMAMMRDSHATVDEFTSRRARKEALVSVLSRVVNTRVPLDDVLRTHYPWNADQADTMRATFAAYVAHKRSHDLLDYDDLLTLWRALVLDDGVGPLVTARFDHVLVDEYQDTNTAQADILRAMAGRGVTVTAVGDDAQAIYGFRGATVRNILDFPGDFGADVVTLTRNHRSTPQVVEVANRIWAQAAERHDKELVAVRGDGPIPQLVTAGDEHLEARAVVDRLLAAHEAGVALRDQAVLFRTAHHADILEVELTVRNVPFVKFGGLAFLEAAHVKDLLALCRVALNPRDDLAWFRILQRIDEIGPARARALVTALQDCDGSVDAALSHCELPGHLHGPVLALGDSIAECVRRCEAGHCDISSLVAWLAPRLHSLGSVESRRADLDRLADVAATSSLERFLTDLTLDPPASSSDLAGPPLLDDDYVTLSTIHSAKGGEWEIVHLIHAADGNIPSDLATGDAAQIEEERRLFYVAATRARNALVVHVPLRFHHHPRRLDDAHSLAQRSRFLSPEVTAVMREVVQAGDTAVDVATGEISHDVVRRVDAELDALIG